ncbi:dTDP-4-dehydrorhamnose 3,5-epimerase [Candidatus Woesearchaeota archaeon]|nr:dTDP-4-dehydrorhamnose 3,5-epimerase [Candidatus Woesearchaeota archaeon]
MTQDNDIIGGVIIKELNSNEDSRGWLTEIFRSDKDSIRPEMAYVSFTGFGIVRGPHEHKEQSDFFIFIGPGDFELYLWDNRKDSDTFGMKMQMVVGESNKVSVIIPPGVVHGYKSVTEPGSLSINLPDRLYAGKGKKEEVDEIRHEDNDDSEFSIE